MADKKTPRIDLVENDPFSKATNPTSHSTARDDGNWRQQSSSPRIVQIQYSPFSRGFTQAYRPAPTLHTGSFWHFSTIELKDLAISLAAFSLGLAFVFNGGILGGMLGLGPMLLFTIPLFFVMATIAFGPAFIIHELAHKFVARHYGCWAEFRADPNGLRTGVLIAFFIGFLFMAPGAVMVAGNVTRKQNGIIALAGPLSNLVLWILALPVFIFLGDLGIIGQIIGLWLVANAILGAFNMLPFGPLDGRKIKEWSEPVFWSYLAIFITIVYITLFKQEMLLNLA
ncbi:MAG: site-2 protease family protein [Candidatus Thalassarchaeaceae archaeon]|jgi:Zn-dependent protease|nr:site-2 protease family protein [Candidatus Thalassarchaeaceae archaeon]